MPASVETYNKIGLVIERLREGATMREACRASSISWPTVRRALLDAPEMQEMFDEAITDSEDALADILINIDQVHSDAKMAAVVSKNIQWFLARKRPAKYGDRVIVEQASSADKAIVETLRLALERIPLPQQAGAAPMIDVTPAPLTLADLGLD